MRSASDLLLAAKTLQKRRADLGLSISLPEAVALVSNEDKGKPKTEIEDPITAAAEILEEARALQKQHADAGLPVPTDVAAICAVSQARSDKEGKAATTIHAASAVIDDPIEEETVVAAVFNDKELFEGEELSVVW